MAKFNYKIFIGNSEISPDALSLLNEVQIVDQAGITGDTVRISFDDSSGTLELPRTGVKVRVEFGYESDVSPFGTYIIDEVSLSSKGLMQVYGKGFDAHDERLKAVRSRRFDSTNLGEVFSKVALEVGMSLKVEREIFDLPISETYQTNESTLAFLQRLASSNGLTLKINGQYLALTRHGSKASASGRRLAAIEIKKTDSTDWRYSHQKRDSHTAHKSMWTDYKFVKVQSANSEEKPSLVNQSALGFSLSKAEAERKSEANRQKSAQREFNMSINLPGNRDLFAECPVVLSGFRKGIDGSWIIERAEHSLSKSGYRTTLSLYKDR